MSRRTMWIIASMRARRERARERHKIPSDSPLEIIGVRDSYGRVWLIQAASRAELAGIIEELNNAPY